MSYASWHWRIFNVLARLFRLFVCVAGLVGVGSLLLEFLAGRVPTFDSWLGLGLVLLILGMGVVFLRVRPYLVVTRRLATLLSLIICTVALPVQSRAAVIVDNLALGNYGEVAAIGTMDVLYQGFSTGSQSYSLDSIVLGLGTCCGGPDVFIVPDNNGMPSVDLSPGLPTFGSALTGFTTLTVVDPHLLTADVTFTPTTPLILQADTTYWLAVGHPGSENDSSTAGWETTSGPTWSGPGTLDGLVERVGYASPHLVVDDPDHTQLPPQEYVTLQINGTPVAPVPLPTTVWLLISGFVGLGVRARKRSTT